MDALTLLKDRTSTLPRFMAEPGPSDADLAEMVEVATRVPDHGMVRPWRFVVLRGGDRAKMGEVFADALKARKPDASEEATQTERNRGLKEKDAIVAFIYLGTPAGKVPVKQRPEPAKFVESFGVHTV